MKIKILLPALFVIISILLSCSGGGTKTITIVETTDVHGVILPYDFVGKVKLDASLAGIAGYLKKIRRENKQLILLDDGDNLQGQPAEYYYNFIDTVSPHFNSEVMNYLAYDAATVGNHDIEAGHSVYDRIRREYRFPMLAANAVDTKTGKPYFEPYRVIHRNGVKIAVLGMITPAVPTWLTPQLYSGIEFKDMAETAKKWMPEILKEKPDLVVGLFHSGWIKSDGRTDENGSAEVAFKVPGFDVIFNGHDHNAVNEKFVNSAGDTLLIMDGGSRSEKIARADIIFSKRKYNGKGSKKISGAIITVKDYPPDPDFVNRFADRYNIINRYVDKVIGKSVSSVSSRDAYFRCSGFVDLIHSVQLQITGADISFAAPLSFDASIPDGPITVGDMFKLYWYENLLYAINMTGAEIKKYLEYSYSGWVNTMSGPKDLMIKFRLDRYGKPLLFAGKARLQNISYNFDSAAGIEYTVDVSRPEGNRISIKSFTDGRPFAAEKTYRVALNSYRGNGGGGHLTEGAGIKPEQLKSRLISSTERDLRFYIMKAFETGKVVTPSVLNNWRFVPDNWVKVAISRDSTLLFGHAK